VNSTPAHYLIDIDYFLAAEFAVRSASSGIRTNLNRFTSAEALKRNEKFQMSEVNVLDGRNVVLTLKDKVAGPHNTRMQSAGISLTQTTRYAGGQRWHYSETRDTRLIDGITTPASRRPE
jgi:hypothetical protein